MYTLAVVELECPSFSPRWLFCGDAPEMAIHVKKAKGPLDTLHSAVSRAFARTTWAK
jgi:hypothetical protein